MIKEVKKRYSSQLANSLKSTKLHFSLSQSHSSLLLEPEDNKSVTCYTFLKEAGVDIFQSTKLYYSSAGLHVWGGHDSERLLFQANFKEVCVVRENEVFECVDPRQEGLRF